MNIMKSIAILSLVLILGLSSLSPVLAKKLLPQAKPPSTPGGAKITTSTKTKGITTSVKFRGDRRAIIVTFNNLSIASSVNYTLSYSTRGTTQGASGTLNPGTSPDPTSRELIFGTCSHGVCRYDSGITNARLVIITTLKGGKKIQKSFRLKI